MGKKKFDLGGVVLAVGAGMVTLMTYLYGKAVGKDEAYGECNDMIHEAIAALEENPDN